MESPNRLSPARYQQGDWFGVVRNGTVVLLGPDTPHALIDTVWELLASAPEAHEVLHEVTEAFGVSLSRIPPFGIIDSKGALRVFLRGDLELAVQFAQGEERLSGRDVTTWTERRLPDATSYSVRIGAEAGTASASGLPTAGGSLPLNASPLNTSSLNSSSLNSLPLTEGVVLLASLDVGVSSAPPIDGVPAIHPAAAASEEPRMSGPASDETMIDYKEADLGLTIAPGHLVPEPAASAGPAEDPAPAADSDVEETPAEASDVPVHTSTTDPVLPSLENTTNYDHLWDKTVMRNIEDAAVRLDEESDQHDAPAPQMPAAPEPVTPEPVTPEPVTPEPVAPEPTSTVQAPVAAAEGDGPAPWSSAVAPAPGLIDSVPWLRSSPGLPEAGEPPRVGTVPLPQPPSLPPREPAGEDADHDGQTIMKSSLPDDESSPAGTGVEAGHTPAVNGPSVLARVCSQGHANPPTYPLCSVCGLAVSGDAVHVPRPRLGRMRVSTGELIDLEQSLIIGRQPSVSRVQGGTMPRLVQVDSPGGDISRSHVEVRLEGWHVMLCDLKATNGTVLIREGQAPRRLAQNEMAILLDGDIAELGDDISLRFEEIL
ncbi:FHA domain-containing protein [Paenarthrobacter sp. NPDC056912]|uniref:FHA domain-containing protein n=1 Tax=Paenarthrobacter sp. NPDC056912 TaxID=3345965 RepID=UPI0036724BDA